CGRITDPHSFGACRDRSVVQPDHRAQNSSLEGALERRTLGAAEGCLFDGWPARHRKVQIPRLAALARDDLRRSGPETQATAAASRMGATDCALFGPSSLAASSACSARLMTSVTMSIGSYLDCITAS